MKFSIWWPGWKHTYSDESEELQMVEKVGDIFPLFEHKSDALGAVSSKEKPVAVPIQVFGSLAEWQKVSNEIRRKEIVRRVSAVLSREDMEFLGL